MEFGLGAVETATYSDKRGIQRGCRVKPKEAQGHRASFSARRRKKVRTLASIMPQTADADSSTHRWR